jgi:hypothetical protein
VLRLLRVSTVIGALMRGHHECALASAIFPIVVILARGQPETLFAYLRAFLVRALVQASRKQLPSQFREYLSGFWRSPKGSSPAQSHLGNI